MKYTNTALISYFLPNLLKYAFYEWNVFQTVLDLVWTMLTMCLGRLYVMKFIYKR